MKSLRESNARNSVLWDSNNFKRIAAFRHTWILLGKQNPNSGYKLPKRYIRLWELPVWQNHERGLGQCIQNIVESLSSVTENQWVDGCAGALRVAGNSHVCASARSLGYAYTDHLKTWNCAHISFAHNFRRRILSSGYYNVVLIHLFCVFLQLLIFDALKLSQRSRHASPCIRK